MAACLSLKHFPLSIPSGCVRHGDPTTAIINETFASWNMSHICSGKVLRIGDVLKKEEGRRKGETVKHDFFFFWVPSSASGERGESEWVSELRGGIERDGALERDGSQWVSPKALTPGGFDAIFPRREST